MIIAGFQLIFLRTDNDMIVYKYSIIMPGVCLWIVTLKGTILFIPDCGLIWIDCIDVTTPDMIVLYMFIYLHNI